MDRRAAGDSSAILRVLAGDELPTNRAALHLSASSVEKHVSSIFAKLGLAEEPVHRRVAAVLAFLGHG